MIIIFFFKENVGIVGAMSLFDIQGGGVRVQGPVRQGSVVRQVRDVVQLYVEVNQINSFCNLDTCGLPGLPWNPVERSGWIPSGRASRPWTWGGARTWRRSSTWQSSGSASRCGNSWHGGDDQDDTKDDLHFDEDVVVDDNDHDDGEDDNNYKLVPLIWHLQ